LKIDFFIAKRLIKPGINKDRISSPIIKIAIVSIAIGVIIMLISMATGFGLQNKIREKISAFSGHIIISDYDNNQSDLTLNPIPLEQDFYPKFKGIKGIKNVQTYASIGGILRTEKDFEGIIYKGVGPFYDWSIFKPYLQKGKIPDFSGVKMNDSIVISQSLADRLNLDLKDKVPGYFIREGSDKPQLRVFKIAGIYNTGFEDFDKTYILGQLKMVQRLYKWPDSLTGGFEIILDDFNDIDNKTLEIYHSIPADLNAQSIKDKYPLIFNWLQMFDFNILMILVIIIFIAGLNMITTILVLIMEKRQFIAIMKVMGSDNRRLRRIFLLQALYVISIGLLIGNIVGLGIIYLQKYFGFIKLDPHTYYVKTAPVYIGLKDIIFLNAGVVMVILLMLLVPVLIVGKISPTKVLKFD
jgi:lipoprotein-releasing system permease protein